jgi:hypothetical protein
MKASARRISSDPYKPPITRIASWEDVAGLLEHFSYYRNIPWLFRGVSSVAHDLVPLVGRADWRKPDVHETEPVERSYSKKDELALFAMFKNTAVPFIQHRPETEMEWLAVARHYGVPTRFLDWSEKFLIAVWFAAEGYLENGVDLEPGVWVVWDLKSVPAAELNHPFEVKSPRAYRPPHIVSRIFAQGSVLSIHGDPTRPLNVRRRLLLAIDPAACASLMKRLDDCGINYATVYPGIEGLGKYLAWRYKNALLTGYM